MFTFGEPVFSTRADRIFLSVAADAIGISGYGVEIGGMMDWKAETASGIHSLICFCVVIVVFPFSRRFISPTAYFFTLFDLTFPDLRRNRCYFANLLHAV